MSGENLCTLLAKIVNNFSTDIFTSREDLLANLEESGLVDDEIRYVLAFLLCHKEKFAKTEKMKLILSPELDFVDELNQFYWTRSDPTVFSENFYTKVIKVLKILLGCQFSALEDIRPILQALYFSGYYSTALKSALELIQEIQEAIPPEELMEQFQEFGLPFPQADEKEIWEIVMQQPSLAPSKLGLLILQRPEYAAEIIEAHEFDEIFDGIRGRASHEFLSSLAKQVIKARAAKLHQEILDNVLTPDAAYEELDSLLTLGATVIPLWHPRILQKLQNRIQPYTVDANDLANVPKNALQLSLMKKGFQKRRKNQLKIHNLGGPRIGHSGFIIEYGASKVLLDFGLSVTNIRFPSWTPALEFLDAICISHGHLDHLGGLPLLFRHEDEFQFNWYASPLTKKIAKVLLLDNRNLSLKRLKPLSRFSHPTLSHCIKKENIARVLEAFSPLSAGKPTEIAPDLYVTAIPAGHIPGSVSYLIEAGGKRILYSGDFNMEPSALFPESIKPPVDADVTIFDGTYFTSENFTQENGRETLIQTVANSDRSIIPAFSVGRTQEVIQILSEAGLDKEKDIVTTGMSGKICKMLNLEGKYRIQPAFNYDSFVEGTVFIGGSGMLQGGASRELLEKTRDDPKTSVVLCGYLAPRTLGFDLRSGRASSFYSQNVAYARISAHTSPKPLNQFIDSLTGEKYIVHVGALSGFKTRQEVKQVHEAAKKKGLKIFTSGKAVSIDK
ncbi:MAG: MBL fold metallo-hydrolase [Candidatus Heimdallarchaeota archaeon]